MSIVKLYTVFILTSAAVQFTSLALVPQLLSMFIIGILYSWFLLKFRQENQFAKRKYEDYFIVLTGIIAFLLFYSLYINILANSFIIACLFGFYYVAWGVFKHYLQKDLRWYTILEYVFIALLIILIVGIQSNDGYWGRVL